MDQQVGTIGIDTDAGKVRAIADAPQPGIQVRDIDIGAEKTRNDHHGGTFAVRHSQSVVNRGGVQEKEFGAEKRLVPNGKMGVLLMLVRLSRKHRSCGTASRSSQFLGHGTRFCSRDNCAGASRPGQFNGT